MRLIDYLKDKIIAIFSFITLIIFFEIFFIIFDLNIFLLIYIPLTLFLVATLVIFSEYMKKRKFYNNLQAIIKNLDKKYYSNELVKEPNFLEGKILYDILGEINKSYVDNVNKFKISEEEYKEYIELWVHEIKTPIASTKLIIENNTNKITKSIEEEIDKVDKYIEQALYYSKSNNVQNDYIIKKISLEAVINNAIKKNKKNLISKNFRLKIHDLDKIIYSDSKWLEYIISQIITNSIKYSRIDSPEIELYSEEKKDRTVLYIIDNGIGIDKKDINKVFEKGFTGLNGRKFNKSTGIGLYICNKLCNKLGHALGINSVKGEYTKVNISFPINSYSELESR